MRRHPTAPVNIARISVATSGTDFTAPEADFAALIRAAGFCPGRSHLSRRSCRSWDSGWSASGAMRTLAKAAMSEKCPKRKWSDARLRQCASRLTVLGARSASDTSVKRLALTISDFAVCCANPPNGFVRRELQRHSQCRVRS